MHNAAVKNREEVIDILKQKGITIKFLFQSFIIMSYSFFYNLFQGARYEILNSDRKSPFDLAIDSKCKALLDYSSDKEALNRLNQDYFDNEDENYDSDD